MTIKHLVISGGSNTGMIFFGVFKELIESSFVNMKKIESIYATSVGTILATYLCLDYEVQDIENFIINRPWSELYKVDFHTIVRAIQEGGLFGRDVLVNTMKPMLLGKDLSLDITLKEFYDYCGKELHYYTTEYKHLELIDLSYKTHPDWKLVDAIYASSCLPVMFDPFLLNESYYVDGAILKNYPLKQCLDNVNDPETVLGVFHNGNKENKAIRLSTPFMNPTSSYKLIEYTISFLMKLWSMIKHERTEQEENAPYQIGVFCDTQPLKIMESFESRDRRIELVNCGIESAKTFLQKISFLCQPPHQHHNNIRPKLREGFREPTVP